MSKLIAYDLGTGGVKSSLFDEDGRSLAESFVSYDTFYPQKGWYEQDPMDWWRGVCVSTTRLMEDSQCNPKEVVAVSLSGHNYVTVPFDGNNRMLTKRVPIWCDMRSSDMVETFFKDMSYEDWYKTTGNGDPPECYPILKLSWLRRFHPDLFVRIHKVLGSKDFVNYMLTGVLCTDPSYASGFGVFNLSRWDYDDELFDFAGFEKSMFPEIIPSDVVIGRLTREAAAQTGLLEGTPVACGAGDNTCMALGARGIGEGRAYTSLGSSGWIAVTAKEPIIDLETKPFVFAHAIKGYYTSAVSIFSAGNTFRWVRDNLCKDLSKGEYAYDEMNGLAAKVPIGSNGILFNPTFAGGSAQESTSDFTGSIIGLTLGNTRNDIIRASMEAVAMALRCTLDILRKHANLDTTMLLCGGGSKSKLWRQIFSDVYNLKILKTNVDQDAASLGAAAIAANAVGVWDGYEIIDKIHIIEDITAPISENNAEYEQLLEIYKKWTTTLTLICDEMAMMRVRHWKNE